MVIHKFAFLGRSPGLRLTKREKLRLKNMDKQIKKMEAQDLVDDIRLAKKICRDAGFNTTIFPSVLIYVGLRKIDDRLSGIRSELSDLNKR